MTWLVAVGLGALIGLALGALGGGGAILTVPALVYVLGEPARRATGESLLIVGVAAVAGIVAHARAGHVRWGPGVAFGLAGVAASYAGTALNGRVDANVLLLGFAALMVAAGLAMVLRRSGERGGGPAEPAMGAGPPPHGRDIVPAPSSRTAMSGTQASRASTAGLPAPETRGPVVSTAVRPSPTATVRSGLAPRLRGEAVVKLLLAGAAVGFLTGFFGVGGGFVVVPALVMALGYRMPVAVGTSLLVIALNSAAALSARAGHVAFHWSVLIPFALAALAAALAGRRITERVPAAALSKAFTVLLFAVAGYMAVRSGLALTG
jgi:uncharacterized membrane protein YfcA